MAGQSTSLGVPVSGVPVSGGARGPRLIGALGQLGAAHGLGVAPGQMSAPGTHAGHLRNKTHPKPERKHPEGVQKVESQNWQIQKNTWAKNETTGSALKITCKAKASGRKVAVSNLNLLRSTQCKACKPSNFLNGQ